MFVIWTGLLIEILILGIIHSFSIDMVNAGFIAILIHIIFSIVVLISFRTKKKILFLLAYLARVAALFWDLYARSIFVLPNSGADSEMFYNTSIVIANDLDFLGKTRGGMFSNIMGLLFNLIGNERIVGQYINVLLGLSIIFIIYKILKLLDINGNAQLIVLAIAALFPNSIIVSAIFLREIMPTFFVATSLWAYIMWFKTGKMNYAGMALTLLGIASMFHSGVIGIAIGFFFGILFYDRKSNSLKLTLKTLGAFLIVIAVVSVTIYYLDDLVLGKFRNVEDITDIYTTANSMRGGSAYLTSLKINNPLQLALFGPIKIFYFFTAPLPMNWRGFMDIFTFLTDSLLYLYVIILLTKNRHYLGERKTLAIIMIVMLIGAGLIFGIGVSNAGTAVRHRQKLIPLFLIVLAITKNKRHLKYINVIKEGGLYD